MSKAQMQYRESMAMCFFFFFFLFARMKKRDYVLFGYVVI